ncbi:DUF3087 family protein [Agarivorans gilvus]|jgi:hypothetical protein|uniref:Medium chain reductase/dehydrogenase n=1 Tax=Agarivorans gilvus TaxID=680279 RepID=A0ABQ1HVU1_9ALTE|nr:DUF3087 family protein [Agarivorans gilvus]GGA92365.1 medium chain reductase/dehydrogenase [Agarivorans gilvus]
MQLQNIDKSTYQTRSRNSYLALCGLLIIFTLAWSTLFIALFSNSENNFIFNLLGVIAALLSVLPIVNYCKNKAWFAEVIYVWRLKRELNKINRKMRHLVQAMNRGEADAFVIVKFSYVGSRQIWQLDDNTLMLNELNRSEHKLAEQAEKLGIEVDENRYRSEMLAKY